nr:hypothetical protein [Candidatus Competibacter phosphatis]
MLNPPDQISQHHATAQRNQRVKRREGADLLSSGGVHPFPRVVEARLADWSGMVKTTQIWVLRGGYKGR